MKRITQFISITLFCFFTHILHAHQIAIIGTGYVGLVTGACLAHFGNNVTCADIDAHKINQLQNGIITIHEPGLAELVAQEQSNGQLSFTSNPAQAIAHADVIFIAVGTPTNEDGSADLRYVENVIKTIAHTITSKKIIVTKSTVPIGTGNWIEQELIHTYHIDPQLFTIVSNPEFLREGSAVHDFLHPDRLVFGTTCDETLACMYEIYRPLIDAQIPVVACSIATAETIKYASNSFLATKISFINEIANLCDKTGADIDTVATSMGLDQRISPHFLKPGPGFGGSCFPKDTCALVHTGNKWNVALNTVQGALTTNQAQRLMPFYKVKRLLNDALKGKTIGILGLAFKANTDDIRYCPSLYVIEKLLEHGAIIKTYDPQAMNNMHKIFPHITYCNNALDACRECDAIIIMTEWAEFKTLNLHEIGLVMHNKILIDARNILDYVDLNTAGFIWENIGRSYLCNN